ncbi:MAG TPA: tRNA epoxyqueuosine(34) reductase QueG [Polyangiaceae bacterium]
MSNPAALIRERAHALGFDKVGIASAKEPLEPEHARYLDFVERGMHGTMDYLAAAADARRGVDSPAILEGATSVICVAESYAGESAWGDGEGVVHNLARYARGSDYHNHLRRRLRRLAAFVRRLGSGVRARPVTDAVPMLERAWARRAGLGFVGKNGLIIVPGVGSYVLLGEVVTTLELESDQPMVERCGSCSLCLDACPTSAFEQPLVLDPRRCISYLTIELDGAMPVHLREGVGDHLFGCDVCQDVCPYNRAADAKPGNVRRAETLRYRPLPRWTEQTVEQLAAFGEAEFDELVRGSPVKRASFAGLVRNAVTVLANRRDPRYKDLFQRLVRDHPDAAVREHAAWALTLLEAPCDA